MRGKPYGADVLVPATFEGKGEDLRPGALLDRIPARHREFTDRLLAGHGIEPSERRGRATVTIGDEAGEQLLARSGS